MSKIICDICGTSYPETAKQCPICGCVRPGDVQRVTNEVKTDGTTSTGYTHVKGGRFSKSNVKKRNAGSVAPKPVKAEKPAGKIPEPEKNKKPEQKREKKTEEKPAEKSAEKSNRGLVITAIFLILAIIAVVVYIAVRFFMPYSNPNPTDPTDTTGATGTTTITGPSDPQKITCTDVTVDISAITFDQIGAEKQLNVVVLPANTTDVIVYRSSNHAVATVNGTGKITIVGEGTATITVTCGSIVKECQVTCKLPVEPPVTDPTKPTTPTQPTEPQETFRLNRKDITFSYDGESWVLYSGTVAKNLITFSSDNTAVATFVDGKVVAVGPGTTNVHAEYEGQKVSCIIRCSFKEDESGVGGNGGVGEDGGQSGTNYKIYTQYGNETTDVTIRVGESVTLYLKDSAGNNATVTWSITGDGCTISGAKITGAVSGSITTVTTTLNGKTYTCIVRVS